MNITDTFSCIKLSGNSELPATLAKLTCIKRQLENKTKYGSLMLASKYIECIKCEQGIEIFETFKSHPDFPKLKIYIREKDKT